MIFQRVWRSSTFALSGATCITPNGIFWRLEHPFFAQKLIPLFYQRFLLYFLLFKFTMSASIFVRDITTSRGRQLIRITFFKKKGGLFFACEAVALGVRNRMQQYLQACDRGYGFPLEVFGFWILSFKKDYSGFKLLIVNSVIVYEFLEKLYS